MTKIEALTTIIKQSNLNCDGIDCANCPFNILDDKPYSCCLILDDELDKVKPIEMAIVDAMNETKEEEGIPKKCEPDRNTRIIPTSKTLSHTTPDHYRLDPEPIDVIRGWNLGFCLGNVAKYLARAGRKEGESRDKDLHKAMEYLRMELEDEG